MNEYVIEYHRDRERYVVYQLDSGFLVEVRQSLSLRGAIRRAWLDQISFA